MARLRIPRAAATTIDTVALLEGEIVHDTTADEMRLGDGATLGGKRLVAAAATVTISAAMIDVVTATTRRNGAAEIAEGLSIFEPNSSPDGVTDNTSAIQAAVTAALAAVSGGAAGAIVYLGPGHWRTTAAFLINEDRVGVVMAAPEVCTVEQLTWGAPVWKFENADYCLLQGGRGLNQQTKSVLSQSVADRVYGEVKRTVAAFATFYNCDFPRVDEVWGEGFVSVISLIGAQRIQNTSAGASDYDSLLLNAAEAQANDYYNNWYAIVLDDGAGAASNWTVVSDYDAASNTATLNPPLTVNGPAKTVSQITRSGATATALCADTSGLANGSVAYLSGAAQSEYNGVFAVANVVANTSFDYTVSGTPASPATLASGYSSLQAAKVIDPSGTHTYILRKNVRSTGARLTNTFGESCDYDILWLDQDDMIIRGHEHLNGEQSQGVTAHALYGSGDTDTDYYKSGRVRIESVSGAGCHGDLVKVRAEDVTIDGLHAERCRSGLALERCDAFLVTGVHARDCGEYYGGADTSAYGINSSDSKNGQIVDPNIAISATYASASQRAYGVSIDADARAVSNVLVRGAKVTSHSNAAAGVTGIYVAHNASPGPQASISRVIADTPEFVQIGTAAMRGAHFEKGSGHELRLPYASGITGDLYRTDSVVSGVSVELDEGRIPSGWTRTNSGSGTLLSFVPRGQISWTPVLAGTGGAANTYSAQTGFYRDLGGGLAWIQFRVVLTALNSTGNLKITGFPRTFSSTYFGQALHAFEADNLTALADFNIIAHGASGSTDINLRKRTSTSGGTAALQPADISATLDIICNGVVMIGDVAVA